MEPTTSPGPSGPAPDLDRARRPGVPKERPPEAWPNSRFPPARMQGRPSAPRHGRPGKPMPPVFGTAVPPRGLSGLVRRAAYRQPDHVMRHWTLLLLADRVESWTTRTRRVLGVALPVAVLALLGSRALRGARR